MLVEVLLHERDYSSDEWWEVRHDTFVTIHRPLPLHRREGVTAELAKDQRICIHAHNVINSSHLGHLEDLAIPEAAHYNTTHTSRDAVAGADSSAYCGGSPTSQSQVCKASELAQTQVVLSS